MRIIKLSILTCLMAIIIGCQSDDDATTVVLEAPSNVSVLVSVTQDNTGLATLTPLAEGATRFNIDFGDGSEIATDIPQGESVTHIFEEGIYTATVEAFGLDEQSTTITQEIQVAFQAPENLVVTIENDETISKQVNVSASADFALGFEVDFGQDGSEPVAGNDGDTVSFIYDEAGIYTITVTAFSAAIETLTFTEEFEVTEILQPIAPTPTPTRPAENVIAIYSDAYDAITTNEFPTSWSNSGFAELEINGNSFINYSNLAFTGIVTDYDNPTDLTEMEFVHFDYWSLEASSLSFKIVNTVVDPVQEDIASAGDITLGEWVSVDIPLDDFNVDRSQITQLLFDTLGNTATVFIDNIYFYRVPDNNTAFDDGLLVNGDFENGSAPWLIGVDDNSSAPVVTVDGNTYYSVDVTTAGQPFSVNVSQKLEIIQDETYILTFDAWSNVNRSIIAGIGLSGGDFSNTNETVNINPSITTYSLTLTANGFGAPDARVLFDLGAEVGIVNIDNVSLIVDPGNLLTNGDFEAGSDSWIIGVDDSNPAPVVTVDGNTYYSVDVTAAGNAFDVNVSQKLEIIQDETYTLTFDAWSDVNRSIIAGIGLSGGDFSNTSETVNITTEIITYSLTLTATGFGALDARVLFDSGAEVGLVNIDNVVLSINE
ncbi:MAG: carbohydrate binding domain-containing protein [Bacteroidota bacterium]